MTEPELDYAFLAEYAKVEMNKLTAVGASYTFVYTPTIPAVHLLSIAGRVRASIESGRVPIGIKIVPPGKEYELDLQLDLAPGGDARPYDGKLGLVFAATVQMPLPSEGLYEVHISVDGKHARRLAFEVATSAAQA